jgi:hypothetical protein
VRVRVDQSRDDGLAAEIDAPRVRACELVDVRVRADRDQSIAPDRDGLRDGEPGVDGDDLAVGQHEVSSRLLLSVHGDGGRRHGADDAQQQRCESEASHGTSCDVNESGCGCI